MECWICKREAIMSKPIGWKSNDILSERCCEPSMFKRSYCKECYENENKRIVKTKNEIAKLKKQIMFENAMQLLEKQRYNFYKNKEAIEVVRDKIIEKPDGFDSSYEVVAAIILVSNRIYSKTQVKIGRYQVDFILPDYKIVLEIDGERHKMNKKRDSERDEKIKSMLGNGWDIVRIPTELLDMKAENLVKGIDSLIDYRQKKIINKAVYKM